MVKIKFFVLSGQAKSGPPLAPILGQHQVNLMEFCKLFNLQSLTSYQPGVPVRVKILKLNKKIDYFLKPLSYTTLLKIFILYINRSKLLKFTQLYDIFRIRLKQVDLNRLSLARELFGFLKSSSIRLVKNVKS